MIQCVAKVVLEAREVNKFYMLFLCVKAIDITIVIAIVENFSEVNKYVDANEEETEF